MFKAPISKGALAIAAILLPAMSQAATVECFFSSVDRFSSTGIWEGRIAEDRWFDWSFQEIDIDLNAEILKKLDERVPFLAGNAGQGDVYVVGTEMGVDGRLITVDETGDYFTIWSGFCDISFG